VRSVLTHLATFEKTEPIITTAGEIVPLTMERFRICELYAELLHCSSLSLLNRPIDTGPLYDGEGRLTGGLGGLEELARVISNNSPDTEGEGEERDEADEEVDLEAEMSPPPPSARSLANDADTDSPEASRGTLSSLDSGSSAGDRSHDTGESRDDDEASDGSRSAGYLSEEDPGPMVEVNVHDDDVIDDQPEELQIPHSPQPNSLELTPAPFAVPSPRSRPLGLPPKPESSSPLSHSPSITLSDVASATPSISVVSLPSLSTLDTSELSYAGEVDEDVEDINPFGDPNELSSSPVDNATPTCHVEQRGCDDATVTDANLNTDLLGALDASVDPSNSEPHATGGNKDKRKQPAGEWFKTRMLDLNIFNTVLVGGDDVVMRYAWLILLIGSILRVSHE
jgi:hypothetical protein